MIGLPGVQRVRRLEDRAVAFDRLDLVGDRRDDPVADLVEDPKGIVRLVIERLRPHDPRRSRLDQLDRHEDAARLLAHGSAGDIVDVQLPAGLLGPDVAFGECEDRAARDDEQAPQLGQPGDDVVGEAIGQAAAHPATIRVFDKRHHGQRCTTRRSGAVPGSVDRLQEQGRGGNQERRSGSRGPACFECRPRFANGREVQFLGCEEPFRRGKMLLARGELSALGQRAEQHHVRACIERGELGPSLQVPKRLVRSDWKACRQLFEQPDAAGGEAAPLCDEPGCRTADCGRAPAHPGSRRQTARPTPPAGWRRACRFPARAAAATSTASTRQSPRSSETVSPEVTTRGRPGSSRMLLSLLRHQRSSPRGSLGTSHRSSHRRLRPTGCGSDARDRQTAPAPCARRAAAGRFRRG